MTRKRTWPLVRATWTLAASDAGAWWRGRYSYNGLTVYHAYGGAYHNPYSGREVSMQRPYNPYTNTYSRSASHNPYRGRYGYRYGYAY